MLGGTGVEVVELWAGNNMRLFGFFVLFSCMLLILMWPMYIIFLVNIPTMLAVICVLLF